MNENDNNLISLSKPASSLPFGGGLFSAAKAVKAVDGVSFDIKKGETLGLVGESGCGKSTLGKAILRLTEPTGGKVLYNGNDLAHLPQIAMREQRKDLQMIFQDPYASLNPRMTVGQYHRRADPHVRPGEREVGRVAGAGTDGNRRPEPPLYQALPARVFGRPAAAYRHRPRAGGRPGVYRR